MTRLGMMQFIRLGLGSGAGAGSSATMMREPDIARRLVAIPADEISIRPKEEPAAMNSTQPQSTHRVLYHNNGAPGDEVAYFGRLLVSLANHLSAVSQAEILVVSHAAGVRLLECAGTDDGLRARIDSLRARGVRFLVCANTLANKGIAWRDLPGVTEEDVVPSGVAELAARQLQGFAYIHL